ncbi:MAG: hypothetical protein ACK4GN_04880 [Runella sp.]
MTNAVLRFLDRFRSVFEWLGADYEQLRLIVSLKFLIQNRTPSSLFNSYNKDKNPNQSFWLVCALILFINAIVGLTIFFIDQPYYGLIFPFSYALVMSVMVFVSDFSTTLLDTSDNIIILPRPVQARTIMLARLVHIGSYLLLISFSALLFPIIYAGFKYGPLAAVVCILLTVLQAMIALFVTTLLYMLLIRVMPEERVKDIVSYFQIVFTVVVTLGYQMIGRFFSWIDKDSMGISPETWHYFWPPFWASGTVQWIVKPSEDWSLMIVLALSIPFLSVLILNYLSPTFNHALATLGTGDTQKLLKTTSNRRKSWISKWASICTKSGVERAIFELSWKITARDRRFKLRTYPIFGYMIPVIFIAFKSVFRSLNNNEELSEEYLFPIYMSITVILMFYQQTFFSDDYKASWVYFVTPHSSPRDVLVGNLKVIILKFFTPFYLLSAVPIWWFWGWRVLDDLLLCYGVALTAVMLEVVFKDSFKIPFSKSPETLKELSQTSTLVGLMILLPISGLAHWGLTQLPYGVSAACLVVAFGVYSLYRRYEQITWEQFEL